MIQHLYIIQCDTTLSLIIICHQKHQILNFIYNIDKHLGKITKSILSARLFQNMKVLVMMVLQAYELPTHF